MVDLHSGEHVTCQEVVELVSDHLEGALAPDEAALFEQHLNFCDGCDCYVDQRRATIVTVGRDRAGGGPARDAADAADRLPRPGALVIAYTFLRSDGTGAFTRHPRPRPATGTPGSWVEAPLVPCRSGIHACRLADLPLWLGL